MVQICQKLKFVHRPLPVRPRPPACLVRAACAVVPQGCAPADPAHQRRARSRAAGCAPARGDAQTPGQPIKQSINQSEVYLNFDV